MVEYGFPRRLGDAADGGPLAFGQVPADAVVHPPLSADRPAHDVALAWAGLIGWQTIGILVVVQVGPWSCSPGILPEDLARSGFSKSGRADGAVGSV